MSITAAMVKELREVSGAQRLKAWLALRLKAVLVSRLR